MNTGPLEQSVWLPETGQVELLCPGEATFARGPSLSTESFVVDSLTPRGEAGVCSCMEHSGRPDDLKWRDGTRCGSAPAGIAKTAPAF